MCTTCGCGTATVEGAAHAHARDGKHAHGHGHASDHNPEHAHADGSDGSVHSHSHAQTNQNGHSGHAHDHHHDHDHAQAHTHESAEAEAVVDEAGDRHYGKGIAGVHAPGLSQQRIVQIERDILSKNDAYARENRSSFAAHRVFALNFLSSPGSGKTALLVRAIADLKPRFSIAVIEGDQQTSNDAERIRAAGVRAIQVNTGKGCHLDAHMVGHAFDELDLAAGGLLFIENVGNLVCPAAFDLGEAHKIVLLSVTEGEDKPLKYPHIFAAADLMLLNKSDLLPHVDFDVGACLANALRVNPKLQTLVVSARTGAGMAAFYAWIEARAALEARAVAGG
jgi:hydrogenase nickel incorporation protein HypB